jgi:hypothetical protein
MKKITLKTIYAVNYLMYIIVYIITFGKYKD